MRKTKILHLIDTLITTYKTTAESEPLVLKYTDVDPAIVPWGEIEGLVRGIADYCGFLIINDGSALARLPLILGGTHKLEAFRNELEPQIQDILSWSKTTKPGKNSIQQLELIKPAHKDVLLIFVNKNYSVPVKVTIGGKAKSWPRLLALAEKRTLKLGTDEMKDLCDYMTNPKNKLYTSTGFPPQKIIQVEAGVLRPAVGLGVLTERQYKIRAEKLKRT